MTYTIRAATEADIPLLIPMGRRFFDASGYSQYLEFDPESVAQTLRNLIESEQSSLLLAEVGERPIGFLGALLYPFYFNTQHLTGQEVFWWVDKEHRKTGAGIALLELTEAWAKSKGAQSFAMVALQGSMPERMAELYQSMGYRPNEYSYIKRV